jgi:hypothetical protein
MHRIAPIPPKWALSGKKTSEHIGGLSKSLAPFQSDERVDLGRVGQSPGNTLVQLNEVNAEAGRSQFAPTVSSPLPAPRFPRLETVVIVMEKIQV